MLLATRPSLFGPSSVAARCPLSPQGPRGDGLFHALFFLFSQGFPLLPSCPLKRLGSDHLDVWAPPRGQGGSEGGQLLPAPTLSPSLSGSLQGRKSLALGWDLKLLSEEAPWVQSVWWGTNGMGVAEGGANHD